jgi:hypothetical protein
LGELDQVFRTTASETRNYIIAGIVLLLLLFLFFCIGSLLPDRQVSALGLGAMFVIGIILVIKGMRNRAQALLLFVFTEGLARIHPGNVIIWRWDDLAALFMDKRGATYTYTMLHRDGTSLVMRGSAMNWLPHLGLRLDAELYKRRLPEAQTAYDQGQGIDFGVLRLDRDGLTKGTRNITWSDVKEIEIDIRSYVNVRQKGKVLSWCRVPVNSIPNFSVFKALLQKKVPVLQYQK